LWSGFAVFTAGLFEKGHAGNQSRLLRAAFSINQLGKDCGNLFAIICSF